MLYWKQFRILIAQALAISLLIGLALVHSRGNDTASAAMGGSKAKYGGILTMPTRGRAFDWDIMVSTIFFDLHPMSAPIFGSGNLVKPCPKNVYQLCPSLAKEWSVNDNFTEYTFKIREGVVWHDGKPFTAEDVKFWIELVTRGAKINGKVRRPAWFARDFGDIKSVKVLDGNRVRVTLGSRNSVFLQLIATPYYVIAHPKHLAQSRIKAGEVKVSPREIGLVGTGPFKVEKHQKDVITQVRRFKSYWGKGDNGQALPYLDGIDFVVVPNSSAMDAAFRTGRVDIGAPGGGLALNLQRKAAIDRQFGAGVYYVDPITTSIAGGNATFGFNVLKKGPLQDVRVRRAISLWIDKEEYHAVQGGDGRPSPILNSSNPYTNPDFMTWPGFNPKTREADKAEARRLLTEAGYAKGFSINYNCQNRSTWMTSCQFYQGQLAKLGIDLKLDIMRTAQWTEAGLTLNYDTVQTGGTTQVPIPESTERIFTTYSRSPSARTKHEDPKIPQYYDRLRNAVTEAERIKIWRELERYILLEKVYVVSMGTSKSIVPFRSYVKGKTVPTEGVMNDWDFTTVWLDR